MRIYKNSSAVCLRFLFTILVFFCACTFGGEEQAGPDDDIDLPVMDDTQNDDAADDAQADDSTLEDDSSSDDASDDSAADDAGPDDTADDVADDSFGDDTGTDDTTADDATDDTVIDDSTDDDTGDDDVSSPAGLVIVATDNNGAFSLRQTDDGWVREDFPSPRPDLGATTATSFFYNGEKGWSVWNYFDGLLSTQGFDLLVYNPASGWSVDAAHNQIDGDWNVSHLFATDAQAPWVVSLITAHAHFWCEYALWAFEGSDYVQKTLNHSDYCVYALSFSSPTEGYLSSNNDWVQDGGGSLQKWDGTAWNEAAMPAGYEDGVFDRIVLSDIHNGYFSWSSKTTYESVLLRLNNDVWEAVAPPDGCDDPGEPFSWGLSADSDYAILPAYRVNEKDVFWEYRGGQWSCRQIDYYDIHTSATLVLRDGRAFVLSWGYPDNSLWEMTASSAIRIDLPDMEMTPICLHALGPNAPLYSACAWPYSMY